MRWWRLLHPWSPRSAPRGRRLLSEQPPSRGWGAPPNPLAASSVSRALGSHRHRQQPCFCCCLRVARRECQIPQHSDNRVSLPKPSNPQRSHALSCPRPTAASSSETNRSNRRANPSLSRQSSSRACSCTPLEFPNLPGPSTLPAACLMQRRATPPPQGWGSRAAPILPGRLPLITRPRRPHRVPRKHHPVALHTSRGGMHGAPRDWKAPPAPPSHPAEQILGGRLSHPCLCVGA
mmetsp:Transcript_111820/g.280108  ORF Transcript_111820/g.280108 Transcript_111820/m.280108 type:complete len:235 (-) Transcript_111820:621-1325(-)